MPTCCSIPALLRHLLHLLGHELRPRTPVHRAPPLSTPRDEFLNIHIYFLQQNTRNLEGIKPFVSYLKPPLICVLQFIRVLSNFEEARPLIAEIPGHARCYSSRLPHLSSLLNLHLRI